MNAGEVLALRIERRAEMIARRPVMPEALPGLEFDYPSPEPEPAVTAQDVIAAVVAGFRAEGIPINRAYKGQMAKLTKELLDDGFSIEAVFMAAVLGLQRSAPWEMPRIAQDVENARRGALLTRRQQDRRLQDAMELGVLGENLSRLGEVLMARVVA